MPKARPPATRRRRARKLSECSSWRLLDVLCCGGVYARPKALLKESNRSHEDVLVFGPAARVMGLQRDGPGGRVLDPLVLHRRVAVAADEAVSIFHAKLEQPPLFGLDVRIRPALDAVQRSGGIVRALDVVQLDLIAAAKVRASRPAEN